MMRIREFNELILKMRSVKDFDDEACVEIIKYPTLNEGVTVYFAECGVNIRMDTDVATLRRDVINDPYKGGVTVDT